MNNKGRVLVIDDDKDVIALLRHHLSDAGYHVMHALDGIDGLAIAVSEAPEIVVSDILMPDFDGFGVLAALRTNASTSALPVVVLTVLSDVHSKARAMRLGADAFLSKPVERESLLSTVATELRRSRKRLAEAADLGLDVSIDATAGDARLMRDFATALAARGN